MRKYIDIIETNDRLAAFSAMTRDEFLGKPKITSDSNADRLRPKLLAGMENLPREPFLGRYEAIYDKDGAAVIDGDIVIASYNWGNTLVVHPAYRRQGIGAELVYQYRTRYPDTPPADYRTKASQALQRKVWARIERERPLKEGEEDQSQTVLRDMITRIDRAAFEDWVRDNNDEADDALADPDQTLNELEFYLGDEHSIRIGSSGIVRFWKLTDEVARIIGANPVELYHFTSSPRVPSIKIHGLVADKQSVNGTKTPGVFLTTESSGPAARGYMLNAVNSHHGTARDNAYGVMVTVKMYLNELRHDPDDADIQSGEVQFITDHVAPDRIIEIERA